MVVILASLDNCVRKMCEHRLIRKKIRGEMTNISRIASEGAAAGTLLREDASRLA